MCTLEGHAVTPVCGPVAARECCYSGNKQGFYHISSLTQKLHFAALSLSSGRRADAVLRSSSAQERRAWARLCESEVFTPFTMKHTHTPLSVSQPTQAYAAYVDMFIALKVTPQREETRAGIPGLCLSVFSLWRHQTSALVSERSCQFN